MIQFIQATYKNGQLILQKKLSDSLEGETLNVIVMTKQPVADKKEDFLKFADTVGFNLPTDYSFNRDELYAR